MIRQRATKPGSICRRYAMSISSLLWSFEGRIGRAKFWLGFLLILIMSAILGSLAGIFGVTVEQGRGIVVEELGFAGALYLLAASILVLYSQLAVYTKRFHDRGKSGWWVLIAFVPVVGFLWILIELGMLAGDPGPNAYGPPPEIGMPVHA
jgi:uncharacterized membrane protein YhaH (DUF805 family)